MWGIWNNCAKQWQFGICEPSKNKARRSLYNKIGKDSYKWRFEVRGLPNGKFPQKKI